MMYAAMMNTHGWDAPKYDQRWIPGNWVPELNEGYWLIEKIAILDFLRAEIYEAEGKNQLGAGAGTTAFQSARLLRQYLKWTPMAAYQFGWDALEHAATFFHPYTGDLLNIIAKRRREPPATPGIALDPTGMTEQTYLDAAKRLEAEADVFYTLDLTQLDGWRRLCHVLWCCRMVLLPVSRIHMRAEWLWQYERFLSIVE